MADSDNGVVDSIQTRKNLKAMRTKVKRRLVKLEKGLAEPDPGKLQLAILESCLTQLDTLQEEYDNSSVQLLEVEEDETLLESDEADYGLFDEELTLDMSHCNLLLSRKRVHSAVQMLDNRITSLNDTWMRDPEGDYSDILGDLARNSQTLTDYLQTTNLEEDHPLEGRTTEVCSRLDQLRVKAGTVHKTEDKTTVKLERVSSGYKRAHLSVPSFSGKIRDWQPFWRGFTEAIHDATDLKEATKLSYLREAMVDKSVYNVLNRIPPGPGAYTTAVEELHRRFDKPRAMHKLYLDNVTNLKPVKATQSALKELADILQDSIDGLVRLK